MSYSGGLAKTQNIKLTIAYDGTNYHGFQEQRGTGLATIQETLEKALRELFGYEIKVIGAGRTDAGVHAKGQVVNFYLENRPIPEERIAQAVNGVLPEDIVVIKAEEAVSGFHARFSAVAKTYRYIIYNSSIPSPFYARYSYFVPRRLDLGLLKEGARRLEGRHDFSAFQAAGGTVENTVRTLYSVSVSEKKGQIHLVFKGDGFLYNMVRIMVGTLLEVALGKKEVRTIPDIMACGDRTKAGPTAPPQGLFLESVEY